MSGTVESALMAMAHSPDEDRAADWALIATGRGASGDVLARAWREWRAERATEVQTVGHTCACSHPRTIHARGRGPCYFTACGCRQMRTRP